MSKGWVKVALSALALSVVSIPSAVPAGAEARTGGIPDLTLVSQTQWVTPTQPGFTLNLAVGSGAGPATGLHVSVTIYSRIDDTSQLDQAAGATPQKIPLADGKLPSIPVTATATGMSAATCVTVLPEASSTAPAPGTAGSCAAGAPSVTLDCTPGGGYCDDVYPVSVALLRSGDSSPIDRFTTFITYEEPGVAVNHTGGPLRVGWIVPVGDSGRASASASATANAEALTALLSARHVPATLDVSPTTVAGLAAHGAKGGQRALEQLADLTTTPGPDQLLTPSYVPINIAALAGAGLSSEIALQVARGSQVLHSALLHPSTGQWVDTNAVLTSADAANLATGLLTVHAGQVVVNDADLTSVDSTSGQTFAQPFTLPLTRGGHVTAVAVNSQVDARFAADPGDPALAANQLLANLAFIHFEDEFLMDPRGVVLVPPSGWHASTAFVSTLLSGLSNAQILSPVTLDQLFAQVQIGGNQEPSTRHLQSGATANDGGFSTNTTQRIATYRAQLNSYTTAASGHPPVLTTLSDQLLGTQSDTLNRAARSSSLTAYGRSFDSVLSSISLAAQGTITFTSRTAAIPITVLSSAPYETTVVMTLSSDKFTFPDGATRTLVLNRPTTSVRIAARARTSGDHLPVDVTLHTPDGQLVISRTVVTVHSTSISIVGIALTVLAGLVLLVWWVRTWRRGRRRQPRARAH